MLPQQLSDKMAADFGLSFPVEQIFLCLGGINGMDRSIRMLRKLFQDQGRACVYGFPAPSFYIARWQAESSNVPVCLIHTAQEADYKLTPQQLQRVLTDQPDLRALYLTVTNNPTAYSYSPDELRHLFAVLAAEQPELIIIADLAYIGTADPEMDKASMRALKACAG